MRAFLSILGNNVCRLREHKVKFLLYLFLAAGAIAAAIFANSSSDVIGNIAVISPNNDQITSEYFQTTMLDNEPPLSELVAGKYDAVVVFDEKGVYNIKSIKDDEFVYILNAALQKPSSFNADQIGARGSGTNIMGFMMMFVLMQGGSMIFMFAEDKEKKQIKRIAASPISFTGYLLAHSFFTFIVLLAPIMPILVVARVLLGVELGIGLFQFFILVSLLCVLATSFAVFLVALINKSDSSNMVCSAITILTSVLAGSFYSFDRGNRILEVIIKVLPQKAFLSMSELIEQGVGIYGWHQYGAYIITIITLFFIIGIVKTNKDYVKS